MADSVQDTAYLTTISFRLTAQIQIALGVDLLEEIVLKVVDEVDAFAGRFHFGAELLIDVGKLTK